jgi:ubiquinone/menaquinone biosynthesis C-methylase UbiE
MNSRNFWTNFWSEYESDPLNSDEQSQVFRTRDKSPISQAVWNLTLQEVEICLELNSTDVLLDLACGNGLFAESFYSKVSLIDALDISKTLIEVLDKKYLNNVTTHITDICNYDYPSQYYSKILWYAGIQYIDKKNIIILLTKLRDSLCKGGKIYIGDIPDESKLWIYFNTPERKADYFNGITSNKPLIGTWIQEQWLYQLLIFLGFSHVEIIPQNPKLIYSDFRFDLLATL